MSNSCVYARGRGAALAAALAVVGAVISGCSGQLNCTCGRPGAAASRIVNGVKAGLHEFPWIVGIRRKVPPEAVIPNIPYCAGSLISDRFVLTAAHCLAGLKDRDEMATSELTFGMHYGRSKPPEIQVRNIKNAVLKVQYINTYKDYDVAILETDRPVDITHTVYPICLPYDMKFPTSDPWVVAAGWGRVSYRGRQSEYLMKSRWMELAQHDFCKENTKFKTRMYPLTDRMVCAMSEKTDACVGDSGGPLMYYSLKYYRWFLVGVTSYGYGCNQPNDPGVYTNLFNSNILEWITCANYGQMCKA